MAVLLATIARVNGKNIKGYKRLYAAFEKHISAIPADTDGDVATAITMDGANVFVEIEFDHESGAMSKAEEQDGDGSYGDILTTLEGHCAGNNAALKNQLDKFIGVQCVFVGERKNDGVLEIIGEKGLGIVLKFKQTETGWDFSGKQNYNHFPYDYSDGTIPT